jgi:hypothetical protein
MRRILLCLPLLPLLNGEFVWKRHAELGRLELLEDGRTALVYNYGPQLPPGVPEDRRRCCYLHPVNTPSGVTITDDFPADHYHHRGIFFGWAVVQFEGRTYDNWMLKGIGPRNLSVETTLGPQASLTARNQWMVGERTIADEVQRLVVDPSRGGGREASIEITLTAREAPVVLKPVGDAHKSYGGFNARFAPRSETRITADTGPVTKDEDLNPHTWVEYEAIYGGRRAALRVTPDPANPGGPPQWCLRFYGFAGAAFPGKSPALSSYTLEPGKPLTLRYRLTLRDLP